MLHEISPWEGHTMAKRRGRYQPPETSNSARLSEFFEICGRSIEPAQGSFFFKTEVNEPVIYWSGDATILHAPAVSIIGSRNVTGAGYKRAYRVAKELAACGVVVVSGLAKGVDTAAHRGALSSGGRTVAVIGTPLDRCYPAENGDLQTEIHRNHLLVSQFPIGERTYPSDFPKRNRLMAAVTDGSLIVEASDTSGTLHQAAECIRLGKWLFLMKSVVENRSIDWPQKFLKEERAVVLERAEQVYEKLNT